MWIFSRMFKKTVDSLINKEINLRRQEVQFKIVEFDSVLDNKQKEFNVVLAKTEQDFQCRLEELKTNANQQIESFNILQENIKRKSKDIEIAEKEMASREDALKLSRQEVDSKIKDIDNLKDTYEERQEEYASKLSSLDNLIVKVANEIEKSSKETEELKKVRAKAEEEQKRLWERLDILRDNLNTEDVWIKLWESAYSKAVDSVWLILQKEMLHMVGLSEEKAYLKAKEEFDADLNKRMDYLINMGNDKDSIPFVKVMALKKKIEDVKLNAERIKNVALLEKCLAQEEILGGLI